MATVITTGAHPKALWPGIHAWWGRMYNEHQVEWTDLFDQETSDKQYEEDVEVSGFGLAPVKPEGTGAVYDTEQQLTVTRYTHVAYALGYIVTYEELADNLYEAVSKRRAQALAFSMRQTKENVLANVYNRAFNSTFTIGDGQSVISTGHPTLAGNQSNQLTTAADFSEAAAEDLVIQIMQTQNNRGLKISNLPQSLHIPVQLWFEANRVLKSVLQNDSANNAVNVLKATAAFPRGIKVNHYFTSATAWFIRTNIPRGATYFKRESVSFDQDNDFDTKNAKALSYERYSAGVTDWRQVWGTAGVWSNAFLTERTRFITAGNPLSVMREALRGLIQDGAIFIHSLRMSEIAHPRIIDSSVSTGLYRMARQTSNGGCAYRASGRVNT